MSHVFLSPSLLLPSVAQHFRHQCLWILDVCHSDPLESGFHQHSPCLFPLSVCVYVSFFLMKIQKFRSSCHSFIFQCLIVSNVFHIFIALPIYWQFIVLKYLKTLHCQRPFIIQSIEFTKSGLISIWPKLYDLSWLCYFDDPFDNLLTSVISLFYT